MKNARLEVIDILDKMQFFQGQRAGRELWNEKPFNIQEQDIDNFNRHIRTIRDYIWDLERKLKAYEDAEEQGLLLRLPCKVGDTVWQATSEVHKYIVTCIAIRGDGVIINTQNYETGIGFSFNAKRIGQRYFLTKEEAEQKLAEMKGENSNG